MVLVALTLWSSGLGLARATTTPEAERRAWNKPTPDWWTGPVRYALTEEETREYRFFGSVSERSAFIARFWAARDSTPFTPRNEEEESFWERVCAADELFGETTLSGWRTDRGRVYIVLGPPDEITNYPVPSADELETSRFFNQRRRDTGDLRPGQRGAVDWTYRSLKGSRGNSDGIVRFLRDQTGEFRLSGKIPGGFRLEGGAGLMALRAGQQPGFGSSEAGRQRIPGEDIAGGEGLPWNDLPDSPLSRPDRFEGGLGAAEDLFGFGRASLFERDEAIGPATGVTTTQFFGVVPLRSRFDFFQSGSATTALITLAIPAEEMDKSPSAAAEIFGRLEKVGDRTQVYQFSSTHAAPEEAPRQDVGGRFHRLYEVRGVLPAGEYQVNLGVRVGPRIGAVGERVTVPDFSGDLLRLTGPVLAEEVPDLSAAAAGGRGFVLGKLRMLPKLEPFFPVGGDFGFYFQVYHAVPAAPGGRLHLDLSYDISRRRQGRFVAQGKPVVLRDNSAPTHAFIFPLQGWDRGEYLLTVTVSDRVTGQVESCGVPFVVQ
ncbi:MAG TPA: GWxTD domain-containing protein [Candidatus Polarisedimenticolia bacterium]|jgi:GWxTD domain-containing protein|nr:GWxTD domain-containing protein [Candidatus Polarisedimenticolia bacterium]